MNFANKTILITGVAGYIGSNMAQLLLQNNFKIIGIDNLSNSFSLKITHPNFQFIKADIAQKKIINEIFIKQKIDAVIYLSASIEVGLSMQNAISFYKNNVVNALNFIEIMHQIQSDCNFIFSSTAGVYKTKNNLILEDDEKIPESVYGKTKLIIEQALQDFGEIHKLKYAILRYFNACGADNENNLGENRKIETHLIPLLLRAINRKDYDFYIYGNDYKTKDQTCIRDYIHVKDICLAHLEVLKYLSNVEVGNHHFNIGTQNGFSVLEIVKKAIEISKSNFKIKYHSRRVGDCDSIIACNKKIISTLNWQPRFSSLDEIIESSWIWEKTFKK